MSEEPNKNGENLGIRDDGIRDEKGRFVNGHPNLGAGRPKGRKNFDTIFEEALRKIAEDKNLDNPEREMVTKAVMAALEGNYSYFKDLMDRRYGKAPQPVELEGNNELPIILKVIKNDGTNN